MKRDNDYENQELWFPSNDEPEPEPYLPASLIYQFEATPQLVDEEPGLEIIVSLVRDANMADELEEADAWAVDLLSWSRRITVLFQADRSGIWSRFDPERASQIHIAEGDQAAVALGVADVGLVAHFVPDVAGCFHLRARIYSDGAYLPIDDFSPAPFSIDDMGAARLTVRV